MAREGYIWNRGWILWSKEYRQTYR